MSEFGTPHELAGPPENLLKTRVAVDQARLQRLATQNSIERSRTVLAKTIALLVGLRCASCERQDVGEGKKAA